ncbi:MAG: Do family serine endopeptidase [Hyphomicrobiales bacterium]|nr:Do family serine endopeptidase [Hyphomicrobiales bacterium]
MTRFEQKLRAPDDRALRRKAVLAGGVSLAVVGFLAGVQILGQTPPARAEAPAAFPNIQAFSFAPIVDRVRPAVVSIRVKGETPVRETFSETFPDLPEGGPLDRWFREWGGPPPMGPGQGRGPGLRKGWRHGPRTAGQVIAQGSGFIISADGKVVTNFHVVKDASAVTVVTEDGVEYDAKVVGADEKTDVALLKIQGDKKDFPTVAFTASDVRPGDWVLAVGNPFGLGGSVTAGIVSARGREIGAGPYDDFLQIDAPINRGNSGGPTFDLKGDVVGMNTAIYSPSGGSVGIGFAIPAATVQKVITQLETGGEVVRGWLGVSIQPIGRDLADGLGLKEARGALVAQIRSDTPAAKAGLKAGDAILAVDGRKVKDSRDLARLIAGYAPGAKVDLTVFRGGAEQKLTVELGRMPKDLEKGTNAPDDGAAATSVDDLGLALAPTSEVGGSGGGLTVVDVDPTGVAAQRGVKQGDVVLEIQGKTVATVAQVDEVLRAAKADGRKAVLLRLKSQEGVRFVPLPLAGK